jgi:hypothetical protein
MKCAVKMGLGGMIYIQHFMKTGTGVQEYCLSNFNCCTVGITKGRNV